MLETLGSAPWASLAQPEWNKPDEVPTSLRELASCASYAEAQAAYSRYLFAVGNNHAGTYFPVVLATIPFLGEILQGGSELSQARALDALIDLVGSFAPEPAFELIAQHDGQREELAVLLRMQVVRLSPLIREIGEDPRRGAETIRLARELLEVLDDKVAQPGHAADGASRHR
ncbi:hypothetical protein [Sorangium sp. So ce1182]|uniref:hypothetical protein n=1 Tax=Sorangium sp. So ce1182 TaxID=3133334 RepID=UPI003F5DD77D